jgi:hypothetical protein
MYVPTSSTIASLITYSISSPQQSLSSQLGTATERPMSSPHQSLHRELGNGTERVVSSPHQSLDRELGVATSKLSLTSHQAAHAVLFTNELLCDIIGRLPFREIVSATGTYKFWRNALKGDQHIQEALFLKPTEVREVFCSNYLLNDLEHPISIDHCTIVGKLHPLVYNTRRLNAGEGRRRSAKSFPKLEHLNGDWREMFATQPPCKKAIVTIKEGTRAEKFMCERDTGVTIGDLKDLIDSKMPDQKETAEAQVGVAHYVNQGSLMGMRFTSRCKVRAGEVCRPTRLPVPVLKLDTESSDESEDSEHWPSDHDEDGNFIGGDFADKDLRNDEY